MEDEEEIIAERKNILQCDKNITNQFSNQDAHQQSLAAAEDREPSHLAVAHLKNWKTRRIPALSSLLY